MNRRVTAHVGLAIVATTLSTGLRAQSLAEEPRRAAKPITVVAPQFPAIDATGPVDIRVDVRGIVTAKGAFVVSDVVAPPASQAFVDAITERLEWWRFTPAVDKETCKAVDGPFAFSVWFEGTRAEPHVYVSVPKPETPTPKELRKISAIEVPAISYPRNLTSYEGSVDALFSADEAGNVVSATVLASTPFGLFDAVVLKAARQARVVWNDGRGPEAGKTMCLVQTYTFCLTDVYPRFRFSGCKH